MIYSNQFGHAGLRPIIHEGGGALIRRQRRLLPLFDFSSQQNTYNPEILDTLAETNSNAFFLLYNQGFSEQEESQDRDQFAAAAAHLRNNGLLAIASISPGHSDNTKGTDQQIFARRPNNKKIPSWIPGFHMTCWTNPAWLNTVETIIARAIASGADGINLDPVIFGAAPALIGNHTLGPTGCSCQNCKNSFNTYTQQNNIPAAKNFPPSPSTEPAAYRHFINWRTKTVANAIAAWAARANEIKPDTIIAATLIHPCQIDTPTAFGADPQKLIPLLDILIAETGNLINFEPAGLTYNAPTLETLRARATENIDIISSPRPAGPHIESVPPEHIIRAAQWEAASCGAAPAAHSTTFIDPKTFTPTTLANPDFKTHRDNTAAFWNWIDRNPEAFEATTPRAQTAILHTFTPNPSIATTASSKIALSNTSETARSNDSSNTQSIQAYFKTCQTLAELHIPYAIITENRLNEITTADADIKLLIIPPGHGETSKTHILNFAAAGGKLIFIGPPPAWAPPDNNQSLDIKIFEDNQKETNKTIKNISPLRLALLNKTHSGSPAAYLQHRFPARGSAAKHLKTPGLFRIPEDWKTLYETVRSALNNIGPEIEIEAPPYIHIRQSRNQNATYFIANNLLPGFPGPAHFNLRFPSPVSARIITPDKNKIIYKQDKTINAEAASLTIVEIKTRP